MTAESTSSENKLCNDAANCKNNDEIYKLKYLALLKECKVIETQNCKHAEQIHQMHKVIKRNEKEKRFLIHKLEEFGDDYKTAKIHFFAEEDVKMLSPSSGDPIKKGYSMEKKKKKLKVKKRLHGAPKKPSNAFLIFCQRRRSQLQEEHQKKHKTELSRQEMTKVLADLWRELTDDKKQIYFSLYKEDKVRYATEMKHFQSEMKKQQVNKPLADGDKMQ